jgi:RNA polymerase sigma-70 factor (ECF subfamily)
MDQNSPTDTDLVGATLAGDRERFGLLYDRYARKVRAVAAGVSGDWFTVEDMTQETFLRAYRNLAKLHDPARFGAWIFGIARQVGRERRRTLRRDRHEFQGKVLWQVESSSDVETKVAEREQLEFVMRRLNGLEERQRVAVHAFFLEQQDAGQAAELVGLSRSGFYALLQRAIAQLGVQVRPRETKERAGR